VLLAALAALVAAVFVPTRRRQRPWTALVAVWVVAGHVAAWSQAEDAATRERALVRGSLDWLDIRVSDEAAVTLLRTGGVPSGDRLAQLALWNRSRSRLRPSRSS
jgi:hypothetical protein